MKPIIFSGPMVEAILEGRKTMTRRIPRNYDKILTWHEDAQNIGISAGGQIQSIEDIFRNKRPYSEGDILWVRETWDCSPSNSRDSWDLMYAADGSFNYGVKIPNFNPMLYTPQRWRPSIHMRREAARIFLKVKAVRLERLQDMSEEDAVAEGAVKKPHYIRYGGENCLAIHGRYKKEFAKLWDTLNAKRGYGWDSNPWVWVVEFERIDE